MIRRISIAAFALALAFASPAAAQDFSAVPPGAYTTSQDFGPFESTTGSLLLIADLTVAGSPGAWQLCLCVQEAIDSQVSPQLKFIVCSTGSISDAVDEVYLFSPSYAKTADMKELIVVGVPRRYWVRLTVAGSSPVITGHVSGSEVR